MGARFKLMIEAGGKARTPFSITSPWTTVGRSLRDDISFPECTNVERRHFALRWEGADLTLVDSGSPGRYFVNERDVARNGEVSLKPGDRIVIDHENSLTVHLVSSDQEAADA